MDQVFIEGLEAFGVIGVHDWERQAPRRLLIDLLLFADLHPTAAADGITNTPDYSLLAQAVRQYVRSSSWRTLESLAEALAQLCLEQPGVQRARVRLHKPGAVPHVRSVGVEIERARST